MQQPGPSPVGRARVAQAPPEFSYGADGITHAELRASQARVDVGNARYLTLVFNENYDSPLIRTRPGGTMSIRVPDRSGTHRAHRRARAAGHRH